MSEILASAVLFGLSAGFSPGPLMGLVLAQTLRHGAREGIKVALVPLATDAPIILLSLVMAAGLAELHRGLALVSLAGGCFVLYLGWENLRPLAASPQPTEVSPRSWRKGILTNLLSPSPWLFWLTAGAAMLSRALMTGWVATVLFLAVFYLLLCGAKIGLALLASRSRFVLGGAAFQWLLRSLGVLMVFFAIKLFYDAWRYWRLDQGNIQF